MKLWLLDGPYYTAVVRAPDADAALATAASPAAEVGWAGLGLDAATMRVTELDPDGPAEVLTEHSG